MESPMQPPVHDHYDSRCGPPPRLYFAELMDEYKDMSSFSVGLIVKYRCRPGYYGFKKSLKCLESLEWSEAGKFCKEKSCGYPGEPDNGRLIVLTELHFGSTVNFTCDEGHRLIGRSSIRCMLVSQKVTWSSEVPFCQRIPCYPPPDIPHAKHNGVYKEDFYYGDAVTYTCERGYPLVGEAFIHCTTKDGENGVWSSRPVCGVTPCPAPQVEKGSIVAGDSGTYTYKHKVTLGCSTGHILTGSREIYCQADGTWDPPVPLCEQVIQCSLPQRITNGKYKNQSEVFTIGACVEYSCEPGYKLIGAARIYCMPPGSWSSPAPYCEAKGCVRPDIQNGRITSSKALFNPREIITFECDHDYILQGNRMIQCQSDSTWDSPVPTCVNGSCGLPMSLNFAELTEEYKNKTYFPVGSSVKYMCQPGYAGRRTSVSCLSNLKWSNIDEFCRKKSCENPGDPDNGRLIVPEDLLFGSTVNFACDEGHKLIGQSFIRCVLSGQKVTWNGKVPFCQRIQCYPPPDIPHGRYIYNSKYNQDYYYGDALSYTCEKSYPRVGDNFIHCTTTKDGENGMWSGQAICGVTSCPSPQVKKGSIVAGESGTYTYKHKVTLGCSFGHILTGSRESYCQADGTWDPPVPLCEPVSQCPVPPDIANGKHNATVGEIYTSHMSVTYFCDPGYTLVGKATISCTSSGDWSLPWPLCEVQCSTPQRITNGKYNSLDSEVFTKGTSVEYICEPGFHLTGNATIYCTESGSWSSYPPYCEVVQCPSPPKVLYGKYRTLESATFTNGKSIKYSCEPGYVLIGEAIVYCTASGTWSLPLPRCEVKGCGGPEFKNGRKSSSKLLFKPMEKITFVCDHGYILKGNTTIQCQYDSTWDFPVPHCVKVMQCHRPPQIKNGFHSNQESAVFSDGMSVKYTCEQGYNLAGEATIYCTESGKWNLPAPRCEGNMDTEIPATFHLPFVSQCPSPHPIENGYHFGEAAYVFPAGTTVNYSCISGYVLIGQASIFCTESGTWSFPPPRCEVLQCTPPPFISNGEHDGHRLANFPVGTYVNYTCNRGYLLVGGTSSHCTISGRWSQPVPQCEVLQCTPPPFISNGEHDGHRLANFPVGTYVNYTCNRGYLLVGGTSSHCTISGRWSQPVPQCEVMRCPLPPGITHGSYVWMSGANITYQMSVIYVCDAGYSLVGNPVVICTLQDSGSAKWSEPPKCKGCLAPQEIANGKANTKLLEDFAYGSSITYHCDPGYFLSGTATIYCLFSGTWDPPVPQCKATGCILLQIPGSKKTKVENMIQSGDNVTVECEDGYVLEGSPYIQCQDDFAWDPPVPVCKPGFNLMASISIGSLVGFLLLLVISGIWMAVSKCNKGRYTPANRKEISNSSNGRIECPSVL